MNRTGVTDEQQRLAALRRYDLLDTAPEPEFDGIAKLAAAICGTPIAVVTLVDRNRLWFKSHLGLQISETPRHMAFCSAAVHNEDLLVVEDASGDPRFAESELVAGPEQVRFYAGTPLIDHDGFALGTLGVMDRIKRTLSRAQIDSLRTLARQVVAQIELRSSMEALQQTVRERDESQAQLQLAYQDMERRVVERTAALTEAHASLRAELKQRARDASEAQAIIDSLPGIFYVFDEQGRFLRWNRNFELITQCSSEEVALARPADFFGTTKEKELVRRCISQVFSNGSARIEASLCTRTGQHIPYYFTGVRIELDGRLCVSGMGIDITERRQHEEMLRLRNRAVQASVNAIIITDLQGTIEYANPAFQRITGYSPEEATGRNCRFLQGDDDDQPALIAIRKAVREHEEVSALLRNYRKDGALFWNDVHIAPVRGPDGTATHFVGVLNDVTDIKNYERQLERQASIDALTELANRNVLTDRIRQAIAGAQRNASSVTVGFMDLDNFKFINDSLGHTIGDELLKGVADRLVACLRGQDTIARYGGDEFAFVLVGQRDEKGVAALVDRILKTVDRPFRIGGHKLYVSCSVGLSVYPKDGTDPDTLLKNADAAMYRAKESGRNNFQFYTPAMNERVTERLSLEAKLRQAIVDHEFVLHYQPKVDLRTGRVVGNEALLRWYPHDGGTVSPSVFIPLAEETGLIVPIGEWVLHTACTHAKALEEAGIPSMRVAVNISARQFEPRTLMKTIRHVLDTTGLDASLLELELTESLVMQNPEDVIKVLLDLKEMGLRLAIDDFGTGYSSLSYLQRFPVDRLKIDQSFVRDIGADPNDAIIARAVISLGHSLGMSVIAEGVSSREQLAFLRQNDCDEMQGYLFSKPVPFEELTVLLKEQRALH